MATRVSFDSLIHKLLKVIPEDQIELRGALTKQGDKWFNIAPELRMNDDFWHPIGFILESYLPVLDTEWQIKVRDIYNSGGFLKVE
jgi:hypothetical protein